MIKNKVYYRIEFKLLSPLSVGNGENKKTDRDILLDGRGIPYIPGSSLAGVYRSLFEQETAERYFGKRLTEKEIKESADQGTNLLSDSKIIVYDAELQDLNGWKTHVRDSVALDEYKVGIDGAKFDFQILEPDVCFVTYMEQNMDDDERCLLDDIAAVWQQDGLWFGAKSGRGYGQTKAVKIFKSSFCLAKPEELDAWLKFDMYEAAGWTEISGELRPDRSDDHILREKRMLDIVLTLRQKGGISIRQYSTEVGEPDYMQMTLTDKTPVIPGTSWAGAFRAQMEKLDPQFGRNTQLAQFFFGTVKEKEESGSHRTRVSFSESRLSFPKSGSGQDEGVIYTRNAIDRFTGGTVDGALYTEKTYFDGETQLSIRCDVTDANEQQTARFVRVLAAAIVDLQMGYMAVGGLTGVGHGLFELRSAAVNGTPVPFDGDGVSMYAGLVSAMEREVSRI